jgi:cytochrome b involved in lipid metabolism
VPTPSAATATSVSAPAAGTISSVKFFTFRQVHRHRTAGSCWSVVNKNVYDLTAWTSKHRNRHSFIKVMCGRNGTKAYNRNSGSVAKSNTRLRRYFIGALPTGAPAAAPAAAAVPASTTTPSTYTMTQVAAHSTPADCWAAINGNAYNLTTWIAQHPGGQGPIKAMCGKDGSSSYNAIHKGQAKPEAALAALLLGKLS